MICASIFVRKLAIEKTPNPEVEKERGKVNLTDPIVLLIAGVVCLVIGFGVFEFGLPKKSQAFFKLIGVVMAGYAVLSLAGISLIAEEQAPPASVVGEFNVIASESLNHLTVDNNAKTINWAINIGSYSTPAFVSNCQYFQVIFSIDRGLGTVGLVQTYGDVTTVPSVTNDTTSVSTPILTKTGDQYNAIWTRADATTVYDMVTLTIAEDDDGVTVTLNMTASLTAVQSMHQYDVVNIGLMIGGEVWTVSVLDTT